VNILLATRNAKKLVELQRIVDAAIPGSAADALGVRPASGTVRIVGMNEVDDYVEVPESGLTFAANALLKATEGVKHTGLATIADDSGLTVDVMGGMPGILSARWAGKHGDDDANLDLLLAQIEDLPDEARTASFVCAAALALPDGRTWVVEGRMPGHLIRARRGTGGFGYDPIFVPDGETRTSAELSPAEKDAISHRGRGRGGGGAPGRGGGGRAGGCPAARLLD
jgi:XTP/dITP diphosphohydrolase